MLYYEQVDAQLLLSDPRVDELNSMELNALKLLLDERLQYRSLLTPIKSPTIFFQALNRESDPPNPHSLLARVQTMIADFDERHAARRSSSADPSDSRTRLNGFDQVILNAETIGIEARHDKFLKAGTMEQIADRVRIEMRRAGNSNQYGRWKRVTDLEDDDGSIQ
jgi:hypothetical protein